jgi:predicted alpha/beta superfamily hydrolase
MNKLTRATLIFVIVVLCGTTTFAQAAAQAPAAPTKPFVLGVVEEFRSAVLKEVRTLNIYLPPGYKESGDARYPVIYLLDGSADEDFIHVVGIVQFNNFSWVNRVPRSIVVGIANTDRRRDLTFPTTIESDRLKLGTTGESEKFIAFIERELQPYIDRRYKTTSSRTIIGQSLGGLLATEILFKKPHLFDKYIIISPSLWWDNGSLLELKPEILYPNFFRKIDVYVGVGKEGFAPSKTPRVMEDDARKLAEMIKSARNRNVTVRFDYLPEEDHATVTHQAVFNAFRMLYPPPAAN